MFLLSSFLFAKRENFFTQNFRKKSTKKLATLTPKQVHQLVSQDFSHRSYSLNNDILKNKIDYVIIGSGISGLTLSWLLTLPTVGKKVVLLERNGKLGGKVGGFERKGYMFQTSNFSFCNMRNGGVVFELLRMMTGGFLTSDGDQEEEKFEEKEFAQFRRRKFFHEIILGNNSRNYRRIRVEGYDQLRMVLKREFPQKRDEVEEFFAIVKEIYEDFMEKNCKTLKRSLFAKFFYGWSFSGDTFVNLNKFYSYLNLSTNAAFDKFFGDDEELKAVVAANKFEQLYGTNLNTLPFPFFALFFYDYLNNGSFRLSVSKNQKIKVSVEEEIMKEKSKTKNGVEFGESVEVLEEVEKSHCPNTVLVKKIMENIYYNQKYSNNTYTYSDDINDLLKEGKIRKMEKMKQGKKGKGEMKEEWLYDGSKILGGTHFVNSAVKKILVDVNDVSGKTFASGVELKDGSKIFAKNVISAISMRETLELIDLKYTDKMHKDITRHPTHNYSDLFYVFLGFNKSFKDLTFPKFDIVIGKNCQQVLNKTSNSMETKFDSLKSLNDSFEKGKIPKSEEPVLTGPIKVYFPSAGEKDEQLGKVVVVAEISQHLFQKWKGKKSSEYSTKKEYLVEKKNVTRLILTQVLEFFPSIRNDLKLIESASPCTYYQFMRRESLHSIGLSKKKVSFKAESDIENLHFAGQDSFFIPGFGGGMMSSLLACERILGGRDIFNELLDYISKQKGDKEKEKK